MHHKKSYLTGLFCVLLLAVAGPALARVKLAALPERGLTIIHLDNPRATLVEEERVLPLQKGLNKVDFSWKGVGIDADSIRLTPLSHPDKVVLLNVNFPPSEPALVWEISSADAFEEKVRISYLLFNIDRLITYKALVDREETMMDLRGFAILRNFSGEDFAQAAIQVDDGPPAQEAISHEETRQLPLLKVAGAPIRKVWTFDAALKPWDPETVQGNVGIPVNYELVNSEKSGLGQAALWSGKVRVFQHDGHESTIFSGEDAPKLIPVGEKMEIYIGDSRDIVVTQRQMEKRSINIRKNASEVIVLFDTDEVVTAKIENFKDKPAVLTMLQHILGQWEMLECNLKYERKDAETLKFEIELPANGKKDFKMHFQRRNIRPGLENKSFLM